MALVVLLAMLLSLTGCKSSDYKKAHELAESGDYEGAAAAYQELGDYKDSEERALALEHKVIEQQLESLISQYQSFYNDFGPLSMSNYEAEMGRLEKIIDEFNQFKKETDVSAYSDLEAYIFKVDACNDGLLGIMEIDRDSIAQYYSPGFYMFGSSMALSISSSEAVYNSMLRTLLNLEIPRVTIEWLE